MSRRPHNYKTPLFRPLSSAVKVLGRLRFPPDPRKRLTFPYRLAIAVVLTKDLVDTLAAIRAAGVF